MYYVYILNLSNSKIYIGFTKDIRKRISEHAEGKVFTTKKYLPAKLIYYECYLSFKDAKRRETMLKQFGSTYSHLKKRLIDSIETSQGRGWRPYRR